MPAIYAIVGIVAVLAIGGIILATNQGGGEPEHPPGTNVAANVDRHPSIDPLAGKTTPKTIPHALPTTVPSVPYHSNNSNSGKTLPPDVPSTGDTTTNPPVDTNPTPIKPVAPKPPDNPPPTPETQPAAPVDSRKPVPDAAAQAKSVAQVHEVLKDDFAKAIGPEAARN